MLLLVDHITERNCSAVETTLERIFGHAAGYLFGEVCGIVFRHTFQHRFKDNSFRTFGDCFGGGKNADIILFQHCFVLCRIIAVAGEAVELPYDHHIKRLLSAVLDHSLKLGTIVGLGRIGAVDVGGNNINAVLSGKRCVFSDLSLD